MDNIKFKNKRVLITGGNGYLGGKLAKELLTKGALVISIDIQSNSLCKDVEYFKVDLTDFNQLNDVVHKVAPDLIYHLAATLDRTRDFVLTNKIFQVNVNGTINLLNALKNVNYERLIFTSTSEVYGGNKVNVPFSEDDNFVPASPYSLSKYCAEMSIRTFSEINKKNFIILRLFNFYGNDMSNSFFLPQLIEKLKRNIDFDMTLGEQKRDYLHINDIIETLLLSSKIETKNEIFNVCSGVGISLRELAIKLKSSLKSKSKINFGAIPYRENEVWEMIGNNEKISKIGFKENINFLDNIENE